MLRYSILLLRVIIFFSESASAEFLGNETNQTFVQVNRINQSAESLNNFLGNATKDVKFSQPNDGFVAQKIQSTKYLLGNRTKTFRSPQSRIVGGLDAQRNEFPFIVSYQEVTGKHLCGGSILTKDWVLIAAHCMVLRPRDTQVLAGLLYLGETHPDIQVAAIAEQIIHPNYPGGAQPAANDIVLLHLAWSLRWTLAVQPISLPPANEENYGYAWTAGWGYLSSSHQVPSTRLQQVELSILTLQQCASDLFNIAGGIGPLDQNMVCGRGARTGSETICKGDSGGPLVQGRRIIGITSWTLEPCGINKAPSVYTQVRKYLTFIRYYVPGV